MPVSAFTLYCQPFGRGTSAVLDHPVWGRRVWVPGLIRARVRPVRCTSCDRVIEAGTLAYRVQKSTQPTWKLRLCGDCVERMAAR